MAAAAKPPGVDGRITCPLCGGLIHPVAGKCKHCKEDLSAMRSGRPAAAAPLPPLRGTLPSNGNGNPHVAAAYAATTAPAPMPRVSAPRPHDDAQPILPPRPTGRGVAAQQPRSMWKSWPMLVIVLATIAIVVAVVLMVWPASAGSDGKRALQPPPAPERMDSNPLPPPGQGNNNGADPWGGHSQNTPPPARQTPDPLPPGPAQPIDPNDPFGSMGTLGALGPQGDVMVAMMVHACDKLKTCPDADQTFTSICDQFSTFAQHTSPPTCAAAQRCIAAIDKMDCSASLSNPAAVIQMTDCSTAITGC